MLVQIPPHLLKMRCLRRLVKSMMRPPICAQHFMMYVKKPFYTFTTQDAVAKSLTVDSKKTKRGTNFEKHVY